MAKIKINRTLIISHSPNEAFDGLGNLAGLWGDNGDHPDGNAWIPSKPVSRRDVPAPARPFMRETIVAYIECDDSDEYNRLADALEARGPFVSWAGYEARIIAVVIGF